LRPGEKLGPKRRQRWAARIDEVLEVHFKDDEARVEAMMAFIGCRSPVAVAVRGRMQV
jgi:hypothetical protein